MNFVKMNHTKLYFVAFNSFAINYVDFFKSQLHRQSIVPGPTRSTSPHMHQGLCQLFPEISNDLKKSKNVSLRNL